MGPIERAAAQLQQAMRELIPEDLARLKAEHEATHASGGFLMPDRLNSPIPPNLTGVVQDESVQIAIATLPTIVSQEQFNEYVLSVLAGLGEGSLNADDILTNEDGEVVVSDDGFVLVAG